LGRRTGSNENLQTFLQKPKVKQIQSLLEKGKSVRDICGRLEVSPTTVVKVRKYVEV
jgi:DNA-binding NarL/FixJ family response regulator